jgi:hypothetical protein
MATESEVFAGEGLSVLVQVARGDAGAQLTGCRVFARAVLKAEILICCAIKSNFIAARSNFYENNHKKFRSVAPVVTHLRSSFRFCRQCVNY